MRRFALFLLIGFALGKLLALDGAHGPARMLTLPCAKGLPCSSVVVDTAWSRVVEVKP